MTERYRARPQTARARISNPVSGGQCHLNHLTILRRFSWSPKARFISFISLLVQEITNDIHNRGGYGIQLTPDIGELSMLLFTDDIVLIPDMVFELQKKLDVLYEVATKLGLIVNIDKSKTLVFRKGGRLAGIEKWHVGGKKLEVETEYNYQGFLFATKFNKCYVETSIF